jgi:TP901 family phage tail tape measure protein
VPIAASLIVKVAADVGEVQKGLSQANSATTQFAANAGRSAATAAQGFATLGTAALGAGTVIAAGLVGAVRTAADFEHSMSAVKAASGATGAELAGLSAKALEFGGAVDLAGIDATDAATAMTELAKGGVGVLQMAEAAHGALLLASAGAVSVAEASNTAVRAMNVFGLAGSDVAHVADVMSAAAGKSATDVGQLNAAFNQSASVAQGAGLSLEQLAGTLALLAQNGLEGSDAGTSLKTTIQRLTAPSDEAAKAMEALGIAVFDNNGKIRDFADIADNLKSALSGLSDEQRSAALQTIFGADAIRVANILYKEGGTAVRSWTAAVNDQGFAARQGAERNNNLAGSLDQLKASLQTAAIVAGTSLLPQIRALTTGITGLVDRFTALSPHTQRLAVDAAVGAAGMLLLGGAIVKTTGYIGSLTTAIQSVVGAFAKKEAAKASLTAANATLQGSLAATGGAMTVLKGVITATTGALAAFAALAALGIAIKIVFEMATGGGQSDTAENLLTGMWAKVAGGLRAAADHDPVGTDLGRKIARDWADSIDATIIEDKARHILGDLGGMAAAGALAGAALAGAVPGTEALAGAMGHLATGATAAGDAAAAANPKIKDLAAAGVGGGMAMGAFASATYGLADALGVLQASSGALSGQMGVLQSRIDVLQEKQKEGIPLTQTEADELVTLQVAQQRLADQSGILAAEERAHILAMAGLNSQFGSNISQADVLSAATGRLGQMMGTGAVRGDELARGIIASAGAANTGTQAVGAYSGRIRDIPPAASTSFSTPGLAAAQAGMFFLTKAILAIPKSFTVTAQVDISAALGAIDRLDRSLPHSPAKEGPLRVLPNWDALFDTFAPAIDRAKALVDQFGDDALKKLIEIPSAIAGAIKASVEAFGALADFKTPKVGSVSAFGVSLTDMMEKFATWAGGWEEDVLKQAGTFADTASKATGLFKTGVEAFKALADFAPPAESAVSAFGAALTDTMEKFTTWAGGFEEDSLKAAETFAEGAGKSLGIIKGAVEGLGALRLFVAPAQSTVSEFGAALTDLMEKFQTWAGGFEADGLAAASTFAEAAGKVTGAIKGALDLFKGLQDAGSFEYIQGAMKALDDAVYASLPYIERIGFNLATVAQNLAPKWSDDTGKVIGLVKSISDLFVALAKDAGNFVHIPQTMKVLDDAFFASLQYMQQMAFNAAAWELAANQYQVNVSMGVSEIKLAMARLAELPSSFPSLPGLPDVSPALAGGVAVPAAPPATGGGHTSYASVTINGDIYDGAGFNRRVAEAKATLERRGGW